MIGSKAKETGRKETWQQVSHGLLFCSSADASVFSPSDGDYWTLAKWIVQSTDYAHGQMVEHLLKVRRQNFYFLNHANALLSFVFLVRLHTRLLS